MSPEDLHRLIDLLVAGDITPAEHEELQSLLKADAKARAAFRQRMDLESGLRNWAVETTGAIKQRGCLDCGWGRVSLARRQRRPLTVGGCQARQALEYPTIHCPCGISRFFDLCYCSPVLESKKQRTTDRRFADFRVARRFRDGKSTRAVS